VKLPTAEPPNCPEAERAALAACMLGAPACVEFLEVLGADAVDAFFVPAHQIVCAIILQLHRASQSVDLVSVAERLTAHGKLETVGGVAWLAELAGASPTSANVAHYAGIVRDMSSRRHLQTLSRAMHEQAQDCSTDLAHVLETAEQRIFALSHARVQVAAVHVKNYVREAYARIEAASRGVRDLDGLTSGFPDLDRLTNGFKPGEVTVIAARPSVGKTAFALNIARHVSATEKRGVLVYSLEMTGAQLTSRLVCLTGAIDVGLIKCGHVGRDTLSCAQFAAGQVSDSRIFVDESVSLTPTDLRARSRRQATRDKSLGLIVIDYLQLMHVAGRAENRQNEVAEISRAIKCTARELNVHVLCLSQLSREAEKFAGSGPQLSHLRDSGAIEQDADIVCMLSRPEKEKFGCQTGGLKLRVAKNRNGLTGDVALTFRRGSQEILPGGHDEAPASTGYSADDWDN
jgi:replicative DNA helicase